MGGKGLDLDVDHGRQAAEPLRADAERVDLLVSSMRSSSSGLFGPRRSSSQHVDRLDSASLASSIAFSALPPTPSPIMPGGHQPAPSAGHRLDDPVDDASRRVEGREARLVFRAAALRRDRQLEVSPGTSSTWTIAGVLSRVLTRENSGSATIEARSGLTSSR